MKQLVLFFLLFNFSVTISAQNGSFSDILNYYQEKNFNGVVLVATNGEIDYLASSGIGNRQNGTSLTTKSKFKIASMTKVFTAILVMKLVEEGKLNLEKNIGTYIPTYTGEGKDKVTIHHLLTYSSGIENKLETLELVPYQQKKNLDEFILTYCSGKLVNIPGKVSVYGNTEYILLQKIIENTTGKSYESYLKEIILEPLNLKNTGLIYSENITVGLANSYTYNDSLNLFKNDEPYYSENFFAAGAMYSSAEDLLAFNNAIFNNKLLKETTTKQLLKINEDLGYTAYGFWGSTGWGTFSEPFYYRTGGILGSTSNWINTLENKKTIIVLSNTNAVNLFEFSEQLYLKSIGKPTTIVTTELTQKSENKSLNYLSGTWTLDLRPDPKSEPYLKDFIISTVNGNSFSGEFYGSQFENGFFNSDWENVHFAFTTKDKKNTYFHSGYIAGDKIYGISYSPNRKFTSHWTGIKK